MGGGTINSITKRASSEYPFNKADVGFGTDGIETLRRASHGLADGHEPA